jgi:hypothetical protein
MAAPTAVIQSSSATGMRLWCTERTQEEKELGLKLGAERAFESGKQRYRLMGGRITCSHIAEE